MADRLAVVLAEDEPLVRIVSALALRDEGFEVFEAEHAAEALQILRERASIIHVLFTDVQMPGEMDGIGLAHHTARTWPWIGLLVVSAAGLPGDEDLPDGALFLPKPYEHQHVMTHIHGLVSSAAERRRP